MNCGAACYKRATTHYLKAFASAIIWAMGKARAKRLAKDRRQKIAAAQRRGLDPGGRTDQSFGYRVRRRRSKGCREQHHAIHQSSEQRR